MLTPVTTPNKLTLGTAEPGRRLRVAALAGGPALCARLAALGLLPGTGVTIIRRQERGPMVVAVRGSRAALGRGVARHIAVAPAETESRG